MTREKTLALIADLEADEAAWRAIDPHHVRALLAHQRAQELRDELERAEDPGDLARETLQGYRLSRRAPAGRFRSGHEVYLAYRERFSGVRREHFIGLMLDGKGRPFREWIVSIGSLTASLVHPREVFEPLIRESAAAVLLVHNHPSGDPTPSPEDREITRRLRQVGELVGIRVVDHVAIGDEGYASLAELGWP